MSRGVSINSMDVSGRVSRHSVAAGLGNLTRPRFLSSRGVAWALRSVGRAHTIEDVPTTAAPEIALGPLHHATRATWARPVAAHRALHDCSLLRGL